MLAGYRGRQFGKRQVGRRGTRASAVGDGQRQRLLLNGDGDGTFGNGSLGILLRLRPGLVEPIVRL